MPPGLIKRVKQHFCSLPCGVDAILGNNGYIWLTRTPETKGAIEEGRGARLVLVEEGEAKKKVHAETVVGSGDREKISRVANCIAALSSQFVVISPDTIMDVYNASVERGVETKDICLPLQVKALTDIAREREAEGRRDA